MSQPALKPRTEQRSPDEVRAELRRLRAAIRAANPDLADADWDALADRLGEHVRASRGDTD